MIFKELLRNLDFSLWSNQNEGSFFWFSIILCTQVKSSHVDIGPQYPSKSPHSNLPNNKCDKSNIFGHLVSTYNHILSSFWAGLTWFESHNNFSNPQSWKNLELRLVKAGKSSELAKKLDQIKGPTIDPLFEVGLT